MNSSLLGIIEMNTQSGAEQDVLNEIEMAEETGNQQQLGGLGPARHEIEILDIEKVALAHKAMQFARPRFGQPELVAA